MPRMQAALQGAREVGFTVLSMSLSLIAVFMPILLMGGIVGRLFREFAMTLSVAILISLAISLTTTPMMCAYVLRPIPVTGQHGRALPGQRARLQRDARLLRPHAAPGIAMARPRHADPARQRCASTSISFCDRAQGLLPAAGHRRMIGGIQADQSISFQLMRAEAEAVHRHRRARPGGAEPSIGFTGGGQTNSGFVFVVAEAAGRAQAVDRPGDRPAARQAQPGRRRAAVPAGGAGHPGRRPREQRRSTSTRCRATRSSELYDWAPKLDRGAGEGARADRGQFDQQEKGLETDLIIDRATAARLGLNVSQIDNTLYDAFGQRQVSTIYTALNQYHVVMEVAPQFWQSPETLERHLRQHHAAARSAAPSRPTRSPGPSSRRSRQRRRASRHRPRPSIASDAARNQADEFARQHRPRRDLDRRGGQHRRARPWCRSPRSAISGPAPRRSRSTTRACSSPRRSPSTSARRRR